MTGPTSDLWEVMSTARTIRRFTDEPVDDAALMRCLEAATWAPNGANAQAWRFVVLRSPAQRAVVAEAAAQALAVIEPVYGMSRPAEGDESRRARTYRATYELHDRAGDLTSVLFTHERFDTASELLLGGSIFPAMQNFLLAARALGLGTCLTSWASYAGEAAIREAVGVPDHWMLAGHVVVGWPRGKHGPLRRHPVAQTVAIDRWDARSPMADAQLGWDQIVRGLEAMNPEERRAAMPPTHTTADLVGRVPELAEVKVVDVAIDGPHGEVLARRYRAPGETAGAGFVWAHGGGFIAGDLDMPEAHWVALMVAARGIPVLSIDYRKCLDGVRFPVPSDDVLAAWRWAVANAAELGTTASGLHLGGASAGANLVAGVTKRLRDGAGPLPRTLVLVYPLVHGELPSLSDDLVAALEERGGMFSPDVVRGINVNFTGTEAGLADPYAFAANGDVSGQPPVFVLNSEADELRASGEAYAAQLAMAGVEVTVELEPGTKHGHVNEPDLPAALTSIERIVSWLGTHRAAP